MRPRPIGHRGAGCGRPYPAEDQVTPTPLLSPLPLIYGYRNRTLRYTTPHGTVQFTLKSDRPGHPSVSINLNPSTNPDQPTPPPTSPQTTRNHPDRNAKIGKKWSLGIHIYIFIYLNMWGSTMDSPLWIGTFAPSGWARAWRATTPHPGAFGPAGPMPDMYIYRGRPVCMCIEQHRSKCTCLPGHTPLYRQQSRSIVDCPLWNADDERSVAVRNSYFRSGLSVRSGEHRCVDTD